MVIPAIVLAITLLLVAAAPARAGIDGTIEQVIPISAAGPTSVNTTSYGPTTTQNGIINWDPAKYDGTVTLYFEAVFSSSVATAGNGVVGLFLTSDTTTPVASVTNGATTAVTRVRSGAIGSLAAGEYTLRAKAASGSLSIKEARLIIVQTSNWPTLITATETQIELGDNSNSNSATPVAPTNERFWALPDVASGTPYNATSAATSCSFEGVISTSAASKPGSVNLVGATSGVLATLTTSATVYTRYRTTFTCPSAQVVHVELYNASGGTAKLQNARVIIDQSGANLTKVQAVLPVQTQLTSTTSTSFTTGSSFLWEPANFAGASAADMTATAPYAGVAYEITSGSNTATAQLCDSGSCGAGTALSGSTISGLNSTATDAWATSGAVTLPASATDIQTQYKMNAAGTLQVNSSYLPIDLNFTGSLQLSAPATSTLPAVTLDGTPTSTSGPLGTIRVKDNRLTKAGWTLSASTTGFVNGSNTLAASTVTLTPGSVSSPIGSSMTGVSAGSAGLFGSSRTLLTATSGNGYGSYDINPSETVPLPTTARAGTYSATLTLTLS